MHFIFIISYKMSQVGFQVPYTTQRPRKAFTNKRGDSFAQRDHVFETREPVISEAMNNIIRIVDGLQQDVHLNRGKTTLRSAQRWAANRGAGYNAQKFDIGNTGRDNVVVSNPRGEVISVDGWTHRDTRHPERVAIAEHNYDNPDNRITQQQFRHNVTTPVWDQDNNRFVFSDAGFSEFDKAGAHKIRRSAMNHGALRPSKVFNALVFRPNAKRIRNAVTESFDANTLAEIPAYRRANIIKSIYSDLYFKHIELPALGDANMNIHSNVDRQTRSSLYANRELDRFRFARINQLSQNREQIEEIVQSAINVNVNTIEQMINNPRAVNIPPEVYNQDD